MFMWFWLLCNRWSWWLYPSHKKISQMLLFYWKFTPSIMVNLSHRRHRRQSSRRENNRISLRFYPLWSTQRFFPFIFINSRRRCTKWWLRWRRWRRWRRQWSRGRRGNPYRSFSFLLDKTKNLPARWDNLFFQHNRR